MALELTHADGSAFTGDSVTVQRGIQSSVIHLKVKNNTGSQISNIVMTFAQENPSISGTYIPSGAPAVDEQWGRAQIVGVDSSGTPGQTVRFYGLQACGANLFAVMPTILAGNSIFVDFSLFQPAISGQAISTINVLVQVAGDVGFGPLPMGIGSTGRGVLKNLEMPVTEIVSGGALSATGSPDAYVHRAAVTALIDGIELADASIEDILLNQNDSASAALTTGQSYIALVQDGPTIATPVVTKGLNGTPGVAPAGVADRTQARVVNVIYQSGGTSIIDAGHITNGLVYARYLVTDAGGLAADVGAGFSMCGGYWQYSSDIAVAPLTDATTNYLWKEWNGAVTVTLTNVQPSPGALPLATIVTASGSISSITDTRILI